MLLNRLSVKGLRSLRDVSIKLDKFGIIIGKNDIGKSSILRAIDIFLNDGKPNRDEITHGEIQTEITLTFKLGDEELQSTDLPELIKASLVDGNKLTITKTFILDTKDTFKVKTAEIQIGDKKLKPIEYKSISDLLPQYIYVESIRDIDKATKMTSTSILGRLIMPILLKQSEVSSEINRLKTTISKNINMIVKDIEGFLTEQSPDVQGLIPSSNVSLDKAVDLDLLVDDGFSKTLIGGKGSGIQSSLVVSLFRAYAKHHIGKNIIFGIEEPDAYLHVGAQRKIFHSLQSITENDGQAILTTHSTVFVDRGNLKGITLLRRNEFGDVVAKNVKQDRDLDIVQETLDIKNSDWFQWDAVLMVEGGTEKVVIDIWAKKLGLNLDSMGIKLFILGGKDKILYAANATILDDLGIPYAVILDSDEKDANEYADYLVKNTNLTHYNCFILNKREIENYYPKEAVLAAYPGCQFADVEFESTIADVKKQLMQAINNTSESVIGRKVALCMKQGDVPQEIKDSLSWLGATITSVSMQHQTATRNVAVAME
jgi:putative ATP-dependent endonuclease of OLD family